MIKTDSRGQKRLLLPLAMAMYRPIDAKSISKKIIEWAANLCWRSQENIGFPFRDY
jgi:hypothetical protein